MLKDENILIKQNSAKLIKKKVSDILESESGSDYNKNFFEKMYLLKESQNESKKVKTIFKDLPKKIKVFLYPVNLFLRSIKLSFISSKVY